MSETSELLRDYRRIGSKELCPVCGHKGWCLVARDGSAAICQRVESTKRRKNAGFWHRLSDTPPPSPARRKRVESPKATDDAPTVDWEALARSCHGALGTERRELLAKSLSVSPAALDRLAYGWNAQADTFTTPVRDAWGHCIGIQTRRMDGQKRMIKGSKQGLFIPEGIRGRGPLLVCEGASDTAAALTLGFRSIGRFSCSTGQEDVGMFVRKRTLDRWVVIVADSKPQELAGANELGASLLGGARKVSVLTMPENTKDLRTWLRYGATFSDVMDRIKQAPRPERPCVASGQQTQSAR